MAGSSVQFAIATHIMTALSFYYGKAVTSASLAESVNTDPTFMRKSLSKLAKAGLVVTSRGKFSPTQSSCSDCGCTTIN